jgi:hypothetical protein
MFDHRISQALEIAKDVSELKPLAPGVGSLATAIELLAQSLLDADIKEED